MVGLIALPAVVVVVVVVIVVVRHRMLLPVYDADTGVLFLSGKGDGLMRTFELTDSAPFLNPLVEYKARTFHPFLPFHLKSTRGASPLRWKSESRLLTMGSAHPPHSRTSRRPASRACPSTASTSRSARLVRVLLRLRQQEGLRAHGYGLMCACVCVSAARFYKLSGREVIPISFMVPRLNKDFFQDDLVRTSFPPTHRPLALQCRRPPLSRVRWC